MLINLKKRTEGFTIIEVLIVLAIAGLILLIVFLAVPALQRNGRNTTKRSDVSKVLGAVGEFTSNNGGRPPKSTPLPSDVPALQTSANLSTGTTITTTIPTSVAGITAAPTTNEVEIVTGVTCNPAATHTTATTPSAANYQSEVSPGTLRSVVALYSVEAAGGNQTTQCLGS